MMRKDRRHTGVVPKSTGGNVFTTEFQRKHLHEGSKEDLLQKGASIAQRRSTSSAAPSASTVVSMRPNKRQIIEAYLSDPAIQTRLKNGEVIETTPVKMRGVKISSTGANHEYYKKKKRTLKVQSHSTEPNSHGMYEVDHFEDITGTSKPHQFNTRTRFSP